MTDEPELSEAERKLLDGDYTDPSADGDGRSFDCEHCGEEFDTLTAKRTHRCPQGTAARASEGELDRREIIKPVVHEFGTHLTFADPDDEMSPYWAVVSEWDLALEYKDRDEAFIEDVAGADWTLHESKTRHWEGGIAAPGHDFETYNEYQANLVARDSLADGEARKIQFQFKPSLPNAETVDGTPIQSLPDDLPLGIRVQVDSANVDPDNVIPLLQAFADRMTIQPDYFDPAKLYEPWSNVYNLALYVRLMRSVSEQLVVSENALLEKLARFGSQNRGRGEYKWDNEEIMGHRNAVAMDAETWNKLLEGRTVGTLLKSYHMKNPEKSVGSDTSHPKLEIQFSQEYSDGDFQYIPWDGDGFDLDDLLDELDETLVNALHWAGINLDPDDPAYVTDNYFHSEGAARELRLVDDPIDVVEDVEADLAAQRFHAADLTDAQEDVLRTISDGGTFHYEELAEESGTSPSTVYRTLDRVSTMVHRVNGQIAMEDSVIRERVAGLFEQIDKAAEWADRELRDLASHGTDLPEDSPFARWAERYGVRVGEADPMDYPDVRGEEWMELEINLGQWSEDEIKRILREGGLAARDTSSDLFERLDHAIVRWRDRDGDHKHRKAGGRFSGLLRLGGATIA